MLLPSSKYTLIKLNCAIESMSDRDKRKEQLQETIVSVLRRYPSLRYFQVNILLSNTVQLVNYDRRRDTTTSFPCYY